jgi:integrase
VQIGEKHNASAQQARNVLLNDTTDWHDRRLSTIRAQEIQKRLELVRDGDGDGLKPRGYLANLLHARLRGFFNWCAKQQIGKLAASPMSGIDKPFADVKRRERDWFAGDAGDQAIATIWAVADKLGGVEGQFLKVLLLTGKRKTALSEMRWEKIDASGFWDAPPGRKNKRCHPVPLSSLAQRILHPRQASGPVFPGKRGGLLNVGSFYIERVIDAGAMKDFFLHGVRHLCETKLAELKVKPNIRNLLFDHMAARGSGQVYDHHEYEDEMREAVELWASHIEKLVAPAGARRLR